MFLLLLIVGANKLHLKYFTDLTNKKNLAGCFIQRKILEEKHETISTPSSIRLKILVK